MAFDCFFDEGPCGDILNIFEVLPEISRYLLAAGLIESTPRFRRWFFPVSVSSQPAGMRMAKPPLRPSTCDMFHFFGILKPASSARLRTSVS